MTYPQDASHYGPLASRVLARHVIQADPAALVSETSLRRADTAHAVIAAILDEAAGAAGALREALTVLADDPAAVGAFRTGVQLLAELLDSDESYRAPLALAVDEAEYRSHLTYYLGDLIDDRAADAEAPREQITQLGALTTPRLNPDKARAELAVIVTTSGSKESLRLRNCLALLQALNRQCLDRARYRVVLVEQGELPSTEQVTGALVDDYLFAPNPGAYNKSWALNMAVGAVRETAKLCLIDADALPDRHFLATGLGRALGGETAFLPFTEILHLDEASSALAVGQRLPAGPADLTGLTDERLLRGFSLRGVNGFCVWLTQERYWAVGGHDERYRGWGDEDNEFHSQLSRSAAVSRLPGTMLHLWHPRPRMTVDGLNRPNKHLRGTPRPAFRGPLGDPGRYLQEFERSQLA